MNNGTIKIIIKIVGGGVFSVVIFLIYTNGVDSQYFGIDIAQIINTNIHLMKEILDNLNKSGNNFISNFNFIWEFNFNKLYQYLDTLTLTQEGALFHIVVFLTILTTLSSIVGVFFGNELIKYFNLENRFPILAKYFKLRAKFQRYYLIWNMLILFLICIFAIGINILVFIVG